MSHATDLKLGLTYRLLTLEQTVGEFEKTLDLHLPTVQHRLKKLEQMHHNLGFERPSSAPKPSAVMNEFCIHMMREEWTQAVCLLLPQILTGHLRLYQVGEQLFKELPAFIPDLLTDDETLLSAHRRLLSARSRTIGTSLPMLEGSDYVCIEATLLRDWVLNMQSSLNLPDKQFKNASLHAKPLSHGEQARLRQVKNARWWMNCFGAFNYEKGCPQGFADMGDNLGIYARTRQLIAESDSHVPDAGS